MDSGTNIIDLNLDVLDIIFTELKMVDQINLGCAHPNLKEGFLFHNRGKLNGINLGKFPVKMWDSLLSLCGYMVETLELDENLLFAMTRAIKHCKALQEIVFSLESVNNLCEVRRRLCELKSINSISISWSGEKRKDIDLVTIIPSMQELPNLRKLVLCYFNATALSQLRELTQLEELCILSSHSSLIDIGYICATLKNLRVLDFHGIIKDADSFQVLPQLCPLLEKLTLYLYKTIQIPYFPKLKELEIAIDAPIEQTLGESGHRYAKQLDKLIIYTDEPIENGELLEQLRGIKHFQILD